MQAELANVAVELAGRTVLGPVSAVLAPGQVIGLLGPNGAGKSTLMRAMAGLLDYSGRIALDGRNLAGIDVAERARLVAYLPQARVVGWPMKVADLVGLGRLPFRAYGRPPTADDGARVDAAMRLMDVAALAARPATELSGGEQARVLAARAIAQATPLLVADEPASGLDPAHQIAMMAAFRRLAGEGRAVLVSLHDLTLAARWCDRVLVLDRGALAAEGAPGEVLTPDLLRRVYGIEAHFAQVSGGLVLSPLALAPARSP